MKEKITFTRILIIGLIIFISGIIIYVLRNPNIKNMITNSMIVLILILVVLVLSESFNKFSVSEILEIEKYINTHQK